eukprot:1155037-Pelagomonas_calceolata.AAC.5
MGNCLQAKQPQPLHMNTHLHVEVQVGQGVQELGEGLLEELIVSLIGHVLGVSGPDGLVVVLHAPVPHVVIHSLGHCFNLQQQVWGAAGQA